MGIYSENTTENNPESSYANLSEIVPQLSSVTNLVHPAQQVACIGHNWANIQNLYAK